MISTINSCGGKGDIPLTLQFILLMSSLELYKSYKAILASNAYGAPYAKNAHFRPGGFERFLLVGKHPKPFESQVPCELRTLRALEFCS